MENQELIDESKAFNERINNTKNSFFSVLDDYKRYYVYYNKNPEVTEFQNYYSNSKGQLRQLSKDMLLLTNNINNHIENLDRTMKEKSVKLDDEKKLYDNLVAKLKHYENTQNGSEILIDDSKEEYNMQYYTNWQLFIGIVMLSTSLATLFRKSNTP